MTDIGVDVVGKVDRRGAGGQVDDIAARGEDVHPVLEDVGLHAVDEFLGVVDILAPFHQFAQPVDALFVLVVLARRLLCSASARQYRIPRSGAFPVCGSALRAVCHHRK